MLSCLLAQVHAAMQSKPLMIPDQEVKRNKSGTDEREVEEPRKVEVDVLLTPYGI